MNCNNNFVYPQIFLHRAKLDNEAKDVINESLILQPITFGLLMLRNLSAGWYKEIADIDLSGRLESINVSICFFTKQCRTSLLIHICEVSPEIRAILMEVFCGFRENLYVNTRIVPEIKP